MPQKTLPFLAFLCVFLSCQPEEQHTDFSLCHQELAYARTVPEDLQCLMLENFPKELGPIVLRIDSVMNELSQTFDSKSILSQLEKFPPQEVYLLLAKTYRQYSDELMNFSQTIQGVNAIEKAERLMDTYQKNSRCDSIEMAEIYNRIGIVYEKKVDVEQSILAHQKSLNLNRKLGRIDDITIDLINITNTYCIKRNLLEARNTIQKAFCILDSFPNSDNRLVALNNQAVLLSYEIEQYKWIGHNELAKQANQEILNTLIPVRDSLWAQFERTPTPNLLSPLTYVNANIANCYYALTDPIYADSILLPIRRVLDKTKEFYGGAIPRTYRYFTYPLLAYAQVQKGNIAAGLDTMNMGLAAFILSGKDVEVIGELGKEDILDEAMLIKTLYQKGRLLEMVFEQNPEKNMRFLKEGHQSYQNALNLIDRMRTDFASDAEIESFNYSFNIYVSAASMSAQKIYNLDTIGNKEYLEKALKIADEGKGNTLLQAAYRNLGKFVFKGPKRNLVARENQFRKQIREGKQNYLAATYRGDLAEKEIIQEDLSVKQKEYRFFIEEIKNSENPEVRSYYQSRFGEELLPIEDIQQKLNPQTAIIEYELGMYDATAFIITASNLTAVPIVADSTLYDMIRQYSGQLEYDKKNYSTIAFKLYERLVLPVEKHLSGIENLIIIPDREVSTISFCALLTQPVTYGTRWKDHPYLINEYVISTYYSLAMLGNFFKLQGVIPKDKSSFAAYTASPENGEQIKGKSIDLACSQSSIPKVKEATEQVFKKYFSQNSPEGNHPMASEGQFKLTAPAYKILQLTMHGCFDKNRDVLDNYLQFFEDKKEDGKLTVGEIYGLNLSADLAFLSNCNSGQGVYDQAEGLKGIARAFNYAGCQGVIAPLQSVEDGPTAKLIEFFYDFLKEDGNPAQALAKAQRKYQQENDTHPSEWANFTYIGTGSSINR